MVKLLFADKSCYLWIALLPINDYNEYNNKQLFRVYKSFACIHNWVIVHLMWGFSFCVQLNYYIYITSCHLFYFLLPQPHPTSTHLSHSNCLPNCQNNHHQIGGRESITTVTFCPIRGALTSESCTV